MDQKARPFYIYADPKRPKKTIKSSSFLHFQDLCRIKVASKHVDETDHRSVPIGEEVIEEYAMYSLGVPLSKSNLPRVFAVYLERILRMFKTQSECLDLTSDLQMQILKKNGLTAFCLMAAKWDSFKTGVNVIIQFR